MPSAIGPVLRRMRSARGVSIESLAHRTGIHRATLYRWERGDTIPRVPELSALLAALNATPAQRHTLTNLLPSSRATALLCPAPAHGSAHDASLARGPQPWIPTSGDLWRALRRRRCLSIKQVAAHLGVHATTVSRWETCASLPDADRLDALFTLLAASPSERSALSQRSLLLDAPLWKQPVDADDCAAMFGYLRDDLHAGPVPGADLRFLVLESQLARLAEDEPGLVELRTAAYYAHGAWLEIWGRGREANVYAGRALELASACGPDNANWYLAVALAASVMSAKNPRASAQLILRWLPFVDRPLMQEYLYRDVADYLGQAGSFNGAQQFVQRSRRVAERIGQGGEQAADLVHGRILVRAGRAGEAVRVLPQSLSGPAQFRVQVALQWVRALLMVADRPGADQWYRELEAIIEANGFHHLRPEAEALAQLLS